MLVALVEEVADNPTLFLDRQPETAVSPLYELNLLARNRSRAAHAPLLRLVAHPEDTVDRLISDAITEDLATWLYATSGGQPEGIVQLIENPEAGEWVRGAAIAALAMIAEAYPEQRAAILARFASILEEDEEGPVLSATMNACLDVGHTAARPLIEAAMEDGRIPEFEATIEGLDDSFARYTPGAFLAQQIERYLPEDDLHGSLSWWACFKQDSTSTGQRGAQKAKKKKRKAERAARRKGRR